MYIKLVIYTIPYGTDLMNKLGYDSAWKNVACDVWTQYGPRPVRAEAI